MMEVTAVILYNCEIIFQYPKSYNGTSKLYLYFPQRTVLNEEHFLYTPLSMFAEIGGYVGVLLGASLWQVTMVSINSIKSSA